jgi:hypothetical protein
MARAGARLIPFFIASLCILFCLEFEKIARKKSPATLNKVRGTVHCLLKQAARTES